MWTVYYSRYILGLMKQSKTEVKRFNQMLPQVRLKNREDFDYVKAEADKRYTTIGHIISEALELHRAKLQSK